MKWYLCHIDCLIDSVGWILCNAYALVPSSLLVKSTGIDNKFLLCVGRHGLLLVVLAYRCGSLGPVFCASSYIGLKTE
jgi:hypothetical protein